ncbi:MAG: phosphatase PAP2 family protein [Lysobacterales bacterium]|jgi:undecaprenyl-diphosphatase
MPAVSFEKLDALEGRVCLPINRFARHPLVRLYFRIVSRLGDGVLWYAMLAALPFVYGPSSYLPTVHLAITALAAVGVYKILKKYLVRERPFASHAGVEAVTAPLDKHSFPSGHTLHAVAFLTLLAHYFPELVPLVLPFVISVAASRVILGLHYPSDVAFGALLGWSLARLSLFLPTLLT